MALSASSLLGFSKFQIVFLIFFMQKTHRLRVSSHVTLQCWRPNQHTGRFRGTSTHFVLWVIFGWSSLYCGSEKEVSWDPTAHWNPWGGNPCAHFCNLYNLKLSRQTETILGCLVTQEKPNHRPGNKISLLSCDSGIKYRPTSRIPVSYYSR